MKRIAIANLGCRVNRADGVALGIALDPAQVELCDPDADADLYVVNSCTVTHAAGAQSLKLVRQLARRHPGRPIVFTGCHAQLDAAAAAELAGVVRVVDNPGKAQLPQLIAELLAMPDLVDGRARPAADLDRQQRPAVKVQDGCDSRCSYCIVPTVRGPSRSVPLAEVVAQVTVLAGAGVAEAVLSGVHLGDYRAPAEQGAAEVDLAGLVEQLLARTTIPRLRLSSVDPLEISPPLGRLLVEQPRLCRHLHVPLQSGCDRILSAMNRGYTLATVRERINALRQSGPALCVGFDVIVGFPGEDAAAFEETLCNLRTIDFAYLHVFPFSTRPGTVAASMAGRPAERDVKRRCQILRNLATDRRHAFERSQLGAHLRLVAEREQPATDQPSSADLRAVRGTTDNYLDLVVATKKPLGTLVAVEVTAGGRPGRATEIPG